MEVWNPNLYHGEFRSHGHNPLSLAAEAGFTAFAEDIVVRDFTELLTTPYGEYNRYPVQGALKEKKYGTATLLLRSMQKER